MEENEFTPVVYDPNARISLWFFKIFGFGVYRVLELNSSYLVFQKIFAYNFLLFTQRDFVTKMCLNYYNVHAVINRYAVMPVVAIYFCICLSGYC